MKTKSFGSFMFGYMKLFGLIGLGVGILFFIVTRMGGEIPIVIGSISYEGMTSSLILLIGSPIVMLIIGFITSIFTYGARK
ncbi:hypothetical protein FHR92_002291 [Fontibacillus solani]|uniref:Uncharacterized protein n=1 Tax=Fontibacillus solani TaxID=1572857 RepID=A0A7W3STH5_9BACL|nr:hypothetical protein [Fontibacillus solani]MBA9085824.1 hypothetical protein [Fontibacillus solani]